jgi:hypothetical protein
MQKRKVRIRANEGASVVGELSTIVLPSCGDAVFPPVVLRREVAMRRDPKAPEVTDSGKQKESLNREHISESGRPRLRSLESSAN